MRAVHSLGSVLFAATLLPACSSGGDSVPYLPASAWQNPANTST